MQTDSPEAYFRIAIFLPFLDNFVSQLTTRFLKHRDVIGSFMCLMPLEGSSVTSVEEERLKILIAFYEDVHCSAVAAIGELHLWYEHLQDLKMSQRTAIDFYIACNKDVFPTISVLKILVTLPVSTCTSERSFSTLRRLKTYLRNTTRQERLNGLCMLNIHREIAISPAEVMNELSNVPRRLDFRLS